ncbi:MAG: glycerol-3-phosphate dehydrogenase C-terminal domain-containing protein, partial [Patescibacteria group bacterium]|nr:glycerol-3-phosphate dehydrogenase C-terminal domain-containing protein [Patescibacteria group bacterium]
RDHTIVVSESGLVTITGGKWTTYRKMAEDVIDHAETVAGLEPARSSTEGLQIHGWTKATTSEPHLRMYGSDAAHVVRLRQQQPALAEKLHPAFPVEKAEVVWHARREMARSVEDVLARRTRCLLLNAHASVEAAPTVAALLAEELGKPTAWQKEQVARYGALARGYIYTDPASRSPVQSPD